MLKRVLFSLALISTSLLGVSQNLYKYAVNDSVLVLKNNVPMKNAWAGGLNNPQFNHMDVNFDCALDLVIYDRAGGIVRVYLNDSIQGEPSYHYAPEYARFFPDELYEFMLVRDYNRDGKPDIFTYNSAGFRVFKNVSDTVLKFKKITDYLPAIVFGGLSGVYTISIDYPNIADMDGDGDLDIISFNIYGTFINYYENIAPLNNKDTMIFERTNTCWGNFYENQLNDSLVLGATCKGGGDDAAEASSGSAARHSGATLLTLDLFQNGLPDLIMGDVGYPHVAMVKNGGTLAAANMVSVEYNYPATNSKPIYIPSFPITFFLDVNNDGRKDLIASTNQRDGGMDTGNVWFYENYGANNLPNFQFQQGDLLVGDQIDVGSAAFPVLADISGDGLEDLMIGNLGYFESYDDNTFITEYVSQISYYKNVGTDSTPIFEFVTDDLAGISAKGFVRVAPCFADLDGDGDNDLLFGERNGSLSFYRNVAPAGAMADFQLVADTFMGQFFGVQPSPYLFDVDGDNALDLLVGQKNGNIQLYINQGDSTNPIYTLSATDTLGGIFNYYPGYESNAMPFISKVNGGTNNVLIVADGGGYLRYFDGLDNNLLGLYTQIDSMRVSNSYIGVTGADLTGNDSIELIVGERPGGIMFLNLSEEGYNYSPYPRDTCGIPIDTVDNIKEVKNESFFEVFPNPNEGTFNIKLDALTSGMANISIYDLSGKSVYQQTTSTQSGEVVTINRSGIQAGVYILEMRMDGKVHREKLVIQ